MSRNCIEGVPDIHSCSQLMIENAQLKKKLHRLRSENKTLKLELDEMTERQKIEKLMRDYVTTHNMATQTECVKSHLPGTRNNATRQQNTQKEANAQTNKLVSMHNALMRRYENELKKSMQYVETNTELQLQINTLEQKLKRAVLRIQELESKKRYKRKSSGFDLDHSSSDEDQISHLKKELTKVKKDKSRLAADNKRIKAELKGLDAGFFEEVEDLKYALQQSACLNQQYEGSLRRVCAKFGLPYPHPEKTLEKD